MWKKWLLAVYTAEVETCRAADLESPFSIQEAVLSHGAGEDRLVVLGIRHGALHMLGKQLVYASQVNVSCHGLM